MRDTSRSHLTCRHCSSLGQLAQSVRGRQDAERPGTHGTRTEATLTFPHTCVHIKYYDAVTFRDDNSRTRDGVALSLYLPSSRFCSARRDFYSSPIFNLEFIFNLESVAFINSASINTQRRDEIRFFSKSPDNLNTEIKFEVN